jgi:hypothetical protein
MNIVKRALAITAIVLTSFTASASLINIAGVEWDPSDPEDFEGGSAIIYQQFNLVTGELSGYGRITSLNGYEDICPGCELSYQFGGYTPSADILPPGSDYFKGGWMKFWVDTTPDILTVTDKTALTLDNTGGSDGDGANLLWLDLTGHIIAGAETTFAGMESPLTGLLSGDGALDVVGGAAMSNFDTTMWLLLNDTFTDIVFRGDFDAWTAGTLDVTTGDAILYSRGSADFHGNSIPEPGTLGIFALSLISLAIGVRNRKLNH